MKAEKLIFFDGVCNLCNGFVSFCKKRDHKNQFSYVTLQSKLARDILAAHSISTTELYTVFYVESNNVYSQSKAALKIITQFKGLWKLFYIAYIMPPFIRDFLYRIIAKNRYKIFGKKDSCEISQ